MTASSVLITGATGALGAALAERYAASGTTLVLLGRSAAALKTLGDRCQARGAEVHTYVWDLSTLDGLDEMLLRALQAHRVQLLVLNAGLTSTPAPKEHETIETIRTVMNVNLVSPMIATHAAVAHLRERGGGQIALIGSISAYFGLPITPTYCASKAGLLAWGQAMRGRLARENIKVNIVLPGFFESRMSAQFRSPKPFMLSSEQAADKIVRGLAQDQPCIAFPFVMVWTMKVLSILPTSWSLKLLRLSGFSES
ncbi:MAG: SDR family NAD(P)-dependent oxidoreductase [Burkholderiales bacterium]